MLVPSDMMAAQSKMLYQLNKYYGERVQGRKGQIAKTLREVCKVVQDVLKEVEVQHFFQFGVDFGSIWVDFQPNFMLIDRF